VLEVLVVLEVVEAVRVVQDLLHILLHKEIPADLVVMEYLPILPVVAVVDLEVLVEVQVDLLAVLVVLGFKFQLHLEILSLLQVTLQIQFHIKEVVD
jgi:hypothetical protein